MSTSHGTTPSLWAVAYDEIRNGENEEARRLLAACEQILAQESTQNPSAPVSHPPTSVPQARELSQTLEKKLSDIESSRLSLKIGTKNIVLQHQVKRIIKAVIFLKDFVSSAVSSDPHAGLAWAGICILLPVSMLER